MRICAKTTPWVLICLNTSGNIIPCDYVLLHFTKSYYEKLLGQLESMRKVSADPTFYSLSYLTSPVGWFTFHDEGIEGHLSYRRIRWTFIEWDKQEDISDLLLTPENLKACILSIFENGNAQFTATGLTFGQEYISSEFPLAAILEQVQKLV